MNRLLPIFKRAFLVALFFLAITYLGDYAWFRVRLHNPKPGYPLEVVKIERYYAIHQKNGRVEFTQAEPVSQVCAHSIFPHAGYSPCWYVLRQNGQPIPMVIVTVTRVTAPPR